MRRTRPAVSVGSALLCLCALLIGACSSGGGSDDDESPPAVDTDEGTDGGIDGGATGGASVATDRQMDIARSVFDPTVARFELHTFYERGAEPYVGRLGLTFDDTWDITKQSLAELFSAHGNRELAIPSTLADMLPFDDAGLASRDARQLVELGRSLAPDLVEGDAVNIAIVFVNGLFDDNASILGVHFSDTPFAFVFKDVVRSVGGDSLTQRYVEQTTVVHEIGHTIGLVANGVPMANDHEDAEHPHHTTNDQGVMYWAVESRGGVLSFLTDIIAGGELGLFGPESLLDTQSFMP